MPSHARRFRKILMVVALLPVAILGGWLVLANAALWLAPKLISRQPHLSMTFRAHTLLPGIIHVRAFELRAEDRFVQWGLDVERATVRLRLESLRDQTIHLRDVDADGVRFRLRSKRTAEELARADTAAFPPISGFGPPLRDDARFPDHEPLRDPWTLRMDDVLAHADELWVDGVRHQGDIIATGAWALTFEHRVHVGPAKLVLKGGNVDYLGQRVATGVTGEAALTLNTVDPREVPGAKILEYLDVGGELDAEVAQRVDVRRLAGLEGPLDIATRGGALHATLKLARGELQKGARVQVELPRVSTRSGAVRYSGDLEAVAEVRQPGRISYSVHGRNGRVSLPRHGGLTVHVPRAQVRTSSQGTSLQALSAPRRASVRISNAQLRELRALNALIPDPAGILIKGGSGRVDATIGVELARGIAHGDVLLRSEDLDVRYDGHELRGAMALSLDVGRLTPELERLELDGSKLSLSGMRLLGGRDERPWSGTVTVRDASIDLGRKELFRGRVSARFTDARPLFRTVFARAKVPRWTHGLLTPSNVTADADVAFGRSLVRVRRFDARVGRCDVRGVARLGKNQRRAVTELELGGLRVGVEQVGNATKVKTFAGRRWFDSRRLSAAR